MAGIPEDLIDEILLRLPVKALLRFRCVSKRWRNLIDSPNFVKSQLNLPNKPQLVMAVVVNKKPSIYYSELDSDYIENPSPNFKKLNLPWCDDILYDVSQFFGHYNGLLCCGSRTMRNFVIFNPLIGEHIQVPPLPKEQRCAWGFGYDRDSDDYKIVTLTYLSERVIHVLWIYRVKSGSWKTIVDFPVVFYRNGVFFNGALHWIGYHAGNIGSHVILALNLGNSEYFSVPLPSDSSKELSHLGVLDGCLYAILFDCSDEHCYDLWVMKEYGLKESWTRLGTYNGLYDDRVHLFVGYGGSVVQCNFVSFWRKLIRRKCRGTYKPVLYEPSLVCARSGI